MALDGKLVGVGVLFIAALYLFLNPVSVFTVTETSTDNISSFGTYTYNGSITDVSDIRVNATKSDELLITGYTQGSVVTEEEIAIEEGNNLYTDNLSFDRSFSEISFEGNNTADIDLLDTEITVKEEQNTPYMKNLIALLFAVFGIILAVSG